MLCMRGQHGGGHYEFTTHPAHKMWLGLRNHDPALIAANHLQNCFFICKKPLIVAIEVIYFNADTISGSVMTQSLLKYSFLKLNVNLKKITSFSKHVSLFFFITQLHVSYQKLKNLTSLEDKCNQPNNEPDILLYENRNLDRCLIITLWKSMITVQRKILHHTILPPFYPKSMTHVDSIPF